MKVFSRQGRIKTGLIILIAFLIALAGIRPAAAQKKAADTVSTSDVQFTTITTAADSAATKQKQQAIVKKANDAKPALTSVEKPKTLWEIFIAGFLGGFAAFLMPCIYPMLPLTVSFFTKRGGSRTK